MNKKIKILIIAFAVIIIISFIFIYKIIKITQETQKTTDTSFGINIPGHINLTDQISKKINQLGSKYARLWFLWQYIEPEQGNLTWLDRNNQSYDQKVKNLVDNDMTIVGIVWQAPKWARLKKCKDWDLCPMANHDDYVNFIQKTVEKYKNQIKYWEIWNEPDLGDSVPYWDKNYVELLKISYQAVKKADPEAKILLGGLSTSPKTFENKDILSLEKYYQQGAKDYFDIMNFHFYPADVDPRDYDNPDHGIFARINMIKQIMEKYGDNNKPIWNTEGAYGNDTDEGLQAQYLARYFTAQFAEKINKVFWFHFMTHKDSLLDGNDWGLYYKNGAAKLSSYTYKILADKLNGIDVSKTQTIYQDKDNVYVYKFIKNDKPVYVAWWDYWDEKSKQSKQITIPVDFSGNALITEVVPNAEKGSDLKSDNYPEFFRTEIVTISNNQLTFTIGQNPVFIEEQ